MSDSKNQRTQFTRRSFIKAAGAASALTFAGAAGMLDCSEWLATAHAETAERIARTYHQSHCGGMCSLACTVRDGRLVKVQPNGVGNPDFQTICLKAYRK